MKNFPFLLFCCLLVMPSAAFSIGAYIVGDQLTVHAGSGLILRETAAATGKKIATLEYGSLVTVLKDGYKKTPFSVVPFAGFTIQGFWVKVRSAKGKEGFVFDGFLSKYKTPGSLPNGDAPNAADYDVSSIPERYMLMHFARKGKRIALPTGENTYEHYQVGFVNGAEVEGNTGEGGSEYIIRFNKEVTVEEAYLIGKALWMEDAPKIKSSFSKGVLVLLSEGEVFRIEIKSIGGIVQLIMQYAD